MVAASHEICSRECSGSGYNSSKSRIRNKRRPRISTDDISPARTIWSILASEIRIGLANAAARKPKLVPSVDKTKVTLDHFVMVRIHAMQLHNGFTIRYLRFIYFYLKKRNANICSRYVLTFYEQPFSVLVRSGGRVLPTSLSLSLRPSPVRLRFVLRLIQALCFA